MDPVPFSFFRQNFARLQGNIHVDEEQVREMAREVAREPKTWDDLVWLLAEAELRLRPPLVGGILYQRGIESREVELIPAQVIDHQAKEDVRELAAEVASLGPPCKTSTGSSPSAASSALGRKPRWDE